MTKIETIDGYAIIYSKAEQASVNDGIALESIVDNIFSKEQGKGVMFVKTRLLPDEVNTMDDLIDYLKAIHS